LPETIKRTGVAEREVVGLGLEPNFDCVKRVFDIFSSYARDLNPLVGVGGVSE
jgi:hypothetical protein